jgi:hypothetical protein
MKIRKLFPQIMLYLILIIAYISKLLKIKTFYCIIKGSFMEKMGLFCPLWAKGMEFASIMGKSLIYKMDITVICY